jgi:hypothetical protein
MHKDVGREEKVLTLFFHIFLSHMFGDIFIFFTLFFYIFLIKCKMFGMFSYSLNKKTPFEHTFLYTLEPADTAHLVCASQKQC